MIVVFGDRSFIDELRKRLAEHWSEDLIRYCRTVAAAANSCEETPSADVVIVDELRMRLLIESDHLTDKAIICMAAGHFKYRPGGIDEPDNIMGVNSMNEAIRHALGQEDQAAFA